MLLQIFVPSAIEKMVVRSSKFAALVASVEATEKACLAVYPDSVKVIAAYIDKVEANKNFNNTLKEIENYNINKVRPVITEYLNRLQKLQKVVNAKEIKQISIYTSWSRGGYYGSQCQAFYCDDFNRYEGDKTGGCGYDKESTAIADVLNTPAVRKIVLDYIKTNKLDNYFGYGATRTSIGYGMYISDYSGLPVFDGGVGTSCFISILDKLGFKCLHNWSKTSDCYIFNKQQ